ncbi:MAG: hypothetical protein QM729_19210 [Solirubrobacterales bacterium]
MKADYDSEADAILIELEEVDRWDDEVAIDEAHLCGVALRDDRPVAVSLRHPRKRRDLLQQAARRFDLDATRLDAAVQAALAAPDRAITVARLPA